MMPAMNANIFILLLPTHYSLLQKLESSYSKKQSLISRKLGNLNLTIDS